MRKMADPEAKDIIVPARGSHLIMPDHFSPDAMGCVWFTQVCICVEMYVLMPHTLVAKGLMH